MATANATLPLPTAPRGRNGDNTVIELSGARKTYKSGSIEFEALRGINLGINDGEYVAIMGPSGSGKSTIMNVLGCLDILTKGSYHLAGTDVKDLNEDDLAEIRNQRIGFVFQGFNLLPALPAWRNVELPLIYAGVGKEERRERAVEALGKVGLGDKLDNRPGELSGGQQQRVAVARALVGEPTMILADEPTGNLDSRSTEDVLNLFDQLHANGRTIVLITHEQEVAEHAWRIVHVRDGLIHSDEANRPPASIAAKAKSASAPVPPVKGIPQEAAPNDGNEVISPADMTFDSLVELVEASGSTDDPGEQDDTTPAHTARNRRAPRKRRSSGGQTR